MADNYIYFTFGSCGQVFEKGYVKINADSLAEAQKKFIARYRDNAWKHKGILSYASDYTQQQFDEEEQFRRGPWSVCHEVIL